MDGGNQFANGRKLLFRPDPVNEGDRDLLAIKAAVEIEQMDLEQGMSAPEGRPHTIAGNAVVDSTADTLQPYGVDAVPQRAIAGQTKIRGREPETLPATLAVLDVAKDKPAVAKKCVGVADFSCGEGGPDVTRRDQLAGCPGNRLDDDRPEGMP